MHGLNVKTLNNSDTKKCMVSSCSIKIKALKGATPVMLNSDTTVGFIKLHKTESPKCFAFGTFCSKKIV